MILGFLAAAAVHVAPTDACKVTAERIVCIGLTAAEAGLPGDDATTYVRVIGPKIVEVEVCGGDANRPDVIVCVGGSERRVRLVLPDPPCGTPEASKSIRCIRWTSGSQK